MTEDDLGEDGTRGAVSSPQKGELGLDGIMGRMSFSLRPQEEDLHEGEVESR